MTYTPYHSDWKDFPDTTTPITAAALEYIEAGIVANVGEQGPTGPAGSGGASIDEYQLDAGVAAGVSAVVLDRTPSSPVYAGQWIVIDAYTSQAELRQINTVVGTTVNLVVPLKYAHAANDFIVVVSGALPSSLWGCKGDASTDDVVGLQEGLNQCGDANMILDGLNRIHAVSQPVLLRNGGCFNNITVRAKATFAPAETNNAMGMSMQGVVVPFTADAATEVITTSSAHGIPSDGIQVVFKGSSLPTGLTAGKVYYAYNRTPTTFKVSATLGGAIVDITAAGSGGDVYCEVVSLEKVLLNNVFFDGQNVAGLNGLSLSLQQQSDLNTVRVSNCPGIGIQLKGQQYDCWNLEITGCGTGLYLYGSTFFGYFYGTNVEGCADRAIWMNNANSCGFWGLHLESCPVYLYFDSTADVRAMTFEAVLFNVGSSTTAVQCDSLATSYEMRNVNCFGGDYTAVIVTDSARGYTYDKTAVSPEQKSWVPSFVQMRDNGGDFLLPQLGAWRSVKTLTGTATLNYGSIAAAAQEELTITVSGAKTGDAAYASPAATIESGLVWSAYVSAADTVTVRVANVTGSPINPASVAWRATVENWT